MDKPKKLWSTRKGNNKIRNLETIKKPSDMMAFFLYLDLIISVLIYPS